MTGSKSIEVNPNISQSEICEIDIQETKPFFA
jgi:hypothetical protein